jgi:DNA-binding winged helix-turn-helix (wHTH) protein
MPRYRFENFVLSPRRRVLVRGTDELQLIPRYFDLLVYLVAHRHEAVHRREIFERVWSDVIVSDSALSQAVRTIRRTLDDDSREPRFIRTVSRHGYRFVFDGVVEEQDGEDWPVTRPAAVQHPAAARVSEPGDTTVVAQAALGAAAAGMSAGVIGGVLLAVVPGSTAPITVAPVLATIGAASGALGGGGVAAGIAVATRFQPARPALAAVAGGAAGGLLVGSLVQWLASWTLAAVVGISVSLGGAVEGVLLGGAAGAGLALTRTRVWSTSAATTAMLCAVAALMIAGAGRPLVGGTIHHIAQSSRDSQARLTPLGRLVGEPDFGPISRALLAAGEGAVFGAGVAFGLRRRTT